MFKIIAGKGFHISFQNGYTVSVQFGGGNYCDNYDDAIGYSAYVASGKKGSHTAECAVWGPDEGFMDLSLAGIGCTDAVTNRSSAEDVLKLLNWAASLEAP